MPCFKEQVFVQRDDYCSRYNQYKCLHTLRYVGHSDFFLQEVYKKVEYHACDYASLVFHIDPCENETEWDDRDKKVCHKQRVFVKDVVMVSVGYKEQR